MTTQQVSKHFNNQTQNPNTASLVQEGAYPVNYSRKNSFQTSNSQKPAQHFNHGSMSNYLDWVAGQDEILMIMYQVFDLLEKQFPTNQFNGIIIPQQLIISSTNEKPLDGVFISSIKSLILPTMSERYYTPPERKQRLSSNQYDQLDSPGKDVVWSLGACLCQLIVGSTLEDIRDANENQPLDLDKIVLISLSKQEPKRFADYLWLENMGLLKMMLDTNRATRPDVREVFDQIKAIINLKRSEQTENIFKKQSYLFYPIMDSMFKQTNVSMPLDINSKAESNAQSSNALKTSSFSKIVLECKLMMDVCSLLHNLWCYFKAEPLQKSISAAYSNLLSLLNRIQRAKEWNEQEESQTRAKIEEIRSRALKFDSHLRSAGKQGIFFSHLLLLVTVNEEFQHIFEQNFYQNLLTPEFRSSQQYQPEMHQLRRKTAQVILILALLGKHQLADKEFSSSEEMKIIREIIENPIQLFERKSILLNNIKAELLATPQRN